MSYKYETERATLFTESGVVILLSVHDEARRLIAEAGACTSGKAMGKTTGSSWTMLAALDYLVEQGRLRRVTLPDTTRGQDQIFISGHDQ